MSRQTTAASLATTFAAGERIFAPGSSGEPTDALAALLKQPEFTAGLDIFTSFVPGINHLDLDRLHATARVSGLFMSPRLTTAQAQGRFRHLPLTYSGVLRWLEEAPPDVCIATVSTPNAQGECSLGVAAEFTVRALARARRRIAVVNANMPFVPRGERVALSHFDAWIESSASLKTYSAGAPTPEAVAIAGHVAALIEDGAALQVGLGKAPDAVMGALCDRRGLRLHSGMLSDGVIALSERGALDANWPHTCCVLLGSPRLYTWASSQEIVRVRGCEHTHAPARIAEIDGFTAVNSALTVDLFGQCDLETANGRVVSGAGGAPDFARGARQANRGLSIIALPSLYLTPGNSASRIVPRLGVRNIVSLQRTDVDVVVTENGVADLRGRSVHERAEALINIAAPTSKSDLEAAWLEVRSTI